MKQLILIILSLFFFSCSSQTENKFNLDFETYDSTYKFPKDWFEWGDYNLSADTIYVHSGKFSGKIKSTKKGGSFGSIAYKIPANYKGKSIQLEGYMKIKNVENGFGGLLLRLDGNGKVLAFDNMENQNINGTKDWHKYSITLPYPEDAETIFIAGIMTGTGEAWFDDFILTIDGKDVQTLIEIEKPIYKATLDNEFDLGSKIKFPTLDETLISHLELLGKIWGFLKYNHPEVCKGNYNWDYELFRMLPKYLETKSKLERDQTLLQWISKYVEIDKCTECKETSSEAFLKPDMSWFDEFELNSELKDKLKYIYNNRCQGKHFYIGKGAAGNPDFLNENYYYYMSYDDGGLKLLALYRYWNMINYFFPNKYLTDKNWNDVLKEYIPKFIDSKNKLEYELACIELIGEIDDTHATTSVGFNNVQKIRGQFYPPFSTQFIDDKLVVTDYYNPELKEVSKIEVGDIITHINGKSMKSIVDSISPYYPASNEAAKLRNISRDILRSNKKEISIDYISNNQEHKHSLSLYKKEDLNMRWYNFTDGKCYKMLDGNIGYITLKTITAADVPMIKDTFKNTKGIIIDIRNYPSTFVPFTLGSYFVSSSTPFVKFTNFKLDNPGEFTFTEPLEIPKGEETYKGKLVVLVNEISQSQAEYTTMAFRAGDDTTIVGSTTAGADGNVSSIYLPGGLLTNISGIGVYYPDGRETQRVGIIPDVKIKPTIEGIKQKKDELLEKAIEIINE
ncbi:S41 family peptidase [Yeosuana marina]|mgnify:CR=1 FL=1|uniref:S41 family peptidase n=1 Tax=Yeosuana marina TaxID=1565536 RepID=UPI0030EE74FC|tara:strand:- start:11777 stop:13981 length:2205 start_codon:yes stop_codon:yes gene_type:complete